MLEMDLVTVSGVDIGLCVFFFFKQKTAYEMRISDWSSDVCSSDLNMLHPSSPQWGEEGCSMLRGLMQDAPLLISGILEYAARARTARGRSSRRLSMSRFGGMTGTAATSVRVRLRRLLVSSGLQRATASRRSPGTRTRSEEHTSELQSLMRISY